MADIMDVDVADLDTAAPMVELGLSSLHVVDLTGQLTESLEIEVPATLIYECVTVEGLCAHLDNSIEDAFGMITPNSGVVPAGPVGALPPSPAGVEDFSGQATTATMTLTTMLKSLSSSMRAARFEAVVQGLVENALGIEEQDLDVVTPVVNLGLSSIHVVDLTLEMSELLDLDVSPTLIYECVTIRGVCAHLLEKLGLDAREVISSPIEEGAVLAEGIHSVASSPALEPSIGNHASLAKPEVDIGIVGMACRLPGNSNTPSEFWHLLTNGKDAVVPPPLGRPSNGRPSGYLTEEVVTHFDRDAFSVSALEAAAMDPQQRLLLQCVAEAFEDAGVIVDDLGEHSLTTCW